MTAITAAPTKGYYYGWNIVAVTALSQAASFGIAINCLSLYIPNWSRDLGVPVSVLTLCYTVNGGGFSLLAPLAGAIAEKWSVRLMMTIGLLICAGLFGFASQVRHAWQLITLFATLAPVGMIIAGHLPSALLVSRWFETRRGLAIGLCTMGQTMAGAVLPPILGVVIPMIGWRPLFLIIAGFLALVCAPTAFFVLRDRPTTERGVASELNLDRAKSDTDAAPAILSVREIWSRPNFWLLLLVSVLGAFMSAGVSVNLAPLMLNRGFTVVEAGTLISALGLGALATKLLAGYAIDRVSARIVLSLILLCGVTGVIVLRLAYTYPLLLLGILLVAGCGALTVPVATTVSREFGSANFGRAMGMIVFAIIISVFAPPIVAFMREATHSYDAPLLVLAVGGILALLAAQFLRAPKPT